MPYLSVVINCDSRPQRDDFGGENLTGVCNEDFLTDGIFGKIKAFDGFDKEVIVWIDEHLPVPEKTLDYLRALTDCVVVRRHTSEPNFNDNNYLNALALCRGDIIVHLDQDTCIFTSGKEAIQEQIDLLEQFDFISYPSLFSPNPDHNPNYDYYWCSTRYFMCKRETLDFTEIKKCLNDIDYLYNKYPASVRNPWTEHIIALISKYTGNGVYYPPINHEKLSIFSWGRYEQWLLRRLNEYNYDQIKDWLQSHPIVYPNDIYA